MRDGRGEGLKPMGGDAIYEQKQVKWLSAEIWCNGSSFFFSLKPFNGVLPHV